VSKATVPPGGTVRRIGGNKAPFSISRKKPLVKPFMGLRCQTPPRPRRLTAIVVAPLASSRTGTAAAAG